ncbi:MAG TPA: hypothetical protein VFT90_01335, partial [Chryseosolibacter sp.]|nr:hypothetical protein [Chryseosolibacter sp.]
MKKLSLIAAICLAAFGAHAQTCTLTGTGTVNWPTNGSGLTCSEGGTAVGKTTLVIPFGLTVIFDENTDTWTGTTIEVYGIMRVIANPTVYASVRVKSGGLLDLQGKLALGPDTPGCGYNLIVDGGGTVTLGNNAAERLTICGEVIMRGGGLGACNNCGGTYSGQCPMTNQPYCQPPGGFTGPSAYDDTGYNPTLPVELLYFNANPLDDMVTLKWATTMEENFSEFIVQRS